MRILFAEDEKDLNSILTRKLRDEGYSVDSCMDGQSALEYLKAADYDGAILDVMMPEIDGMEVLRRLRAAGVHTPAMILTAKTQVGDRIEERFSDNPCSDDFATYEEARAFFDGIDLREQWRTERMCAAKAFDGRDAYKHIEQYEVFEDEDGDGYAGDVLVLDEERYGWEEWNGDEGQNRVD